MRKVKLVPIEEEVLNKISLAKEETTNKAYRVLKCPYCRRGAIKVFEDAKGHVQYKCKFCNKETIFNVISFRKVKIKS